MLSPHGWRLNALLTGFEEKHPDLLFLLDLAPLKCLDVIFKPEMNSGRNEGAMGMENGIELTTRRLCYTINGGCEAAAISRSKLYELLDQGLLTDIKIGKRRLILAETLAAFIAGYEAGKGRHIKKRPI